MKQLEEYNDIIQIALVSLVAEQLGVPTDVVLDNKEFFDWESYYNSLDID